MKFLIVEPSPLPILIPLGPKYSPQDPVFKYPLPAFKYSNKHKSAKKDMHTTSTAIITAFTVYSSHVIN